MNSSLLLSGIVKYNGLSIKIATRSLSILARAIWQVLLALTGYQFN
jgi:hypothetical protein